MRLLLTSDGIKNGTIKRTIRNMCDDWISIVFLPTAGNMVGGSKEWLINHFNEFRELGPIDIVDIAVLPREEWLNRINAASLIVMGGGDTTYLMEKIKESGFDKELPRLLREKVYVGISAGGIILSDRLWGSSEYLYTHKYEETPRGLGYLSFNMRPHLNSEDFPQARCDIIEEVARKEPEQELYAFDNDSAIKIEDGKVEVVTEGVWEIFNGKTH